MIIKSKVVIYTDGSCQGNPGPGGWAAILKYGNREKELWGFCADSTNNQMELMAPIQALRALKKPCEVDLFTDSEYVRKGITGWVKTWKKNSWLNSQKKPVKNQELWKILDEIASQHSIDWHWVKGHSGNPDNERVDVLAREAMLDQKTNVTEI